MSAGVLARKILWTRAGNRCSWPDCSTRLTVDEGSPETILLAEQGVALGEEAHIRSSRKVGPRHEAAYPKDKLDSYANLILLCPTHHTLIDKNRGAGWPVKRVEKIKADHEAAVDRAMSLTDLRGRDLEERVAARIQIWESTLGLDRWQDVTFQLNQVPPYLRESDWDRIFGTAEWLLTLDWPEQYPRIAEAFQNHRLALWLLTQFLHEHMTALRNNSHTVDDPHHNIGWDPVLYEKLLREHNISCHGIWLLALEVTRSINFVLTAIRAEFDPLYRFNEGLALLTDGNVISGVTLRRVEYGAATDRLPPTLDFSRLISHLEAALPDGHTTADLHSVNVAEWVAPA